MNNSFVSWALLLGVMGLVAWFSFASWFVPVRHPGTRSARFLSVAGRVILVLGVGSRLYTLYSDRERQRQADSWVVLSLAPITIEDLAPSPDKIPDLIGLVNDPRFQQLAPWQMDLVMIKADPSLEGSSAYKLAMLTDLLTRPPKSLGLAVTVKHHGVTYKAVCSFSKLHYTDPDMPQGLQTGINPVGHC